MMKEGLRFAAPFDFAALRTVLGSASLFALMWWRKMPMRPAGMKQLAVLGVVQTAGFLGFVNLALVTGAAGKTSVIVFIFPFWTLLMAWPLLGERVQGLQWLAVALAALGLTLVLEPWNMEGSGVSKLSALAAGICWALSSILAKRFGAASRMHLVSITAWQMGWGAVVLTIIAWLTPSPPIQWTGYFALILVYNTLLGTVIGWMLWLFILTHMPAGTASLSTLAVPVLGVLLARAQLGERPGAVEIAGMLVIAASLALLSWITIRQQRRVEPETGQE